MHTTDTFREVRDRVDAARDSSALAETELICGLSYSPKGCFWDPYLFDLFQPPFCMYWDGMHCLYSSGGIVQYQVNAYVMALMQHNISLETLDSFAGTVTLPNGLKLGKSFFASRIVTKPNAHIKAFASEVINVVYVLALFTSLVVAPSGMMSQHVECFQLLVAIVKIMKSEAYVLANLDTLESYLEKHGTLYVELYKSIPKNHLVRHVIDCVRRHKKYMTCFAPERDHHYSKTAARHCQNRSHVPMVVLNRSNFAFFTHLQTKADTLFRETFLIDPVSYRTGDPAVKVSRRCMSHLGQLSKKNYVWVSSPLTAQPVWAIPHFLPEVIPASSCVGTCLASVKILQNVRPDVWADRGPDVLLDTSKFLQAACVRKDPSTSELHAYL